MTMAIKISQYQVTRWKTIDHSIKCQFIKCSTGRNIYGSYRIHFVIDSGKIVEKLIDRHNLILLNDSVHTRFDTYHQTSSLLDLSLCHPSIYMDVACEISSDRLGSDHHPIIITANTSDHPVPEFQNGISRRSNGMHSKINVLLK